MTQAYPLQWPAGWKRSPTGGVRHGPFKVTPSQAKKELMEELGRIGATNIVISSDQPLNRDGSISMARRAIYDTGIAVYFKRKGRDVVLACDQYHEMHDNLRAIGKTIEAMRGIERWGASDMLDRAFTGFTALPAPEQWWEVLGIYPQASISEITVAYRAKAREAHPDHGGSDAAMARINRARDEGMKVG